jgi:hypothetical protein
MAHVGAHRVLHAAIDIAWADSLAALLVDCATANALVVLVHPIALRTWGFNCRIFALKVFDGLVCLTERARCGGDRSARRHSEQQEQGQAGHGRSPRHHRRTQAFIDTESVCGHHAAMPPASSVS